MKAKPIFGIQGRELGSVGGQIRIRQQDYCPVSVFHWMCHKYVFFVVAISNCRSSIGFYQSAIVLAATCNDF